MPQTSKAIRNAYDKKTYKTYSTQVRKDSELFAEIEKHREAGADTARPITVILREALEKEFGASSAKNSIIGGN